MDPWSLSDLAPAAWVTLLATLMLTALARWFDRVPLRVVGVFALAIGILYGEVLAGGSVLLPLDNLRGSSPFRELSPADPHGNLLQGDLLHLVHPARREVRRAAAAGEWPLWSPRIGAGLPLLADPQAQVLQPLTALGEGPLSATASPGAVAAVRTLLALVFSFLLLRRLGAGRGPALAGALAFGLGGFLQLWLGWPLANAAALLPATLYALILTSERGWDARAGKGLARDWALLTFTVAALLLAGHPETVVYALAVMGVFAAARWRQLPAGGAWARRLGASFLLALVLASPALLPFAEVLPHTLRWARMTGAAGGAGPAAELEVEPGRLAPGATGPRVAWGERAVLPAPERPPVSRLVQTVAPNALGNSRFIDYWGLRNSNEDAAGFVGTATLLAALLALPGWLVGRRLRGAGGRPLRHELLAVGLTAAAGLLIALPAGWTAHLPGVGPETGAPGRLALVLDLGLVLLATASLERIRRGAFPGWLRWTGPPVAALGLAGFHLWAYRALAHPSAPETLDVLRWGWVHWHLRFALLAAFLLMVGVGRRWTAPALALLVGLELILAHGPANPPAPARLAFPEVATIESVQSDARSSRLGPGQLRLAGVDRALVPNLAAVYGLADIRVFSPMAPARYLRLLEPAISEWWGEVPLLEGREHPVLYDRLGVRWIVAAPEDGCPEGTRREEVGGDGVICQRPAPRPPITLAATPPDALRIGPGGARWEADFRLLPDDGVGRLETGIARLPGWHVLAADSTSPSTPAPVSSRDGTGDATARALLEADLPAGTRRVHLLYRPVGFVAGMLLAAAGLSLLAAWLVPRPR